MGKLSETFGALADPIRRAILARLAQGERTVGELAEPFDISLPAVSKHLRVLENAGLIDHRTDAQWRLCGLRAQCMQNAHKWVDRYQQYWEGSLNRLAELMEKQPQSKRRSK